MAVGPAAQPGELASTVHLPGYLRRWKFPNPVQQEQGHPCPLESLVTVRQGLSPALREWILAVPSGLLLLDHSTARIPRRPQPRPRLPRCLLWMLLALSLARQEWVLAVPSVPRFPRPGTSGIPHHPRPRPRPGHRVPVRHSRNRAGPPGRTSLR